MKSRNYGIDLLRIVSMFYILILHTLYQGGVLTNAAAGTMTYRAAWLMEIWAYCAVDIFALISGYVGYSEKPKRIRIASWITMWLQVVYVGLLCTAVFHIVMPETVHASDYYRMMFPLTNNLYWYFSAYTGLFMIMPVLNAGIRNLSEETLKKTFVAVILIFSVYECVTDRFQFNAGYSVIWLMILYCLGAIIRKCHIGENWKPLHCLAGIAVLTGIAWLWKLKGFQMEFMKAVINQNTLVSYTSPAVVLSGILHIALFSKLRFREGMRKLIAYAAPCAFSVYLFNNQILIWVYVMKDRFAFLGTGRMLKMVPGVLLFSAAFVICSLLADRIRIVLFRFLHVSEAADTAEQLIRKWINRFVSIL